MLDGLRRGGVNGIVKHMPGHGRAMADSHLSLPVVDEAESELKIDVAPFRTLNNAPMGMTAHIVNTTWHRDLPCSLSPTIIGNILRRRYGFDELLMWDALDMKA